MTQTFKFERRFVKISMIAAAVAWAELVIVYVGWWLLQNRLKDSPKIGGGAVLLAIIGWPIVFSAAYLMLLGLGKAYASMAAERWKPYIYKAINWVLVIFPIAAAVEIPAVVIAVITGHSPFK